MVVIFEVAPPFILRPKIERYGVLIRVIWGWFSVAYIRARVNDISAAFREDELQICWNSINVAIKKGPLPGNGCDETAERNGLILASNILMNRLADSQSHRGRKS